ncbi:MULTISPECIES: hypothetical protein [unclassified Streptomyces]|uniref:hypothetical protein n=1 Tax=unclassified Streptomyces TaxID=2593676 RepID=UPI001BE85E37|nr:MULTISPECIES: hypothetical protein [unclassified Streptomyces]MBT2403579.1 hypothetical protein [Streptomyces sp. ISL-21]MBT2609944.1 hypothetical protein [Streptomyces sp. ISL-87]
MTACAIEITTTAPFTIAADGSYAARLAGDGEARYPERWTVAGPEPYAVPLPLAQPEEADSEVLPLADGRVLIHRRVAERHAFALLYPTGGGGAAAGPRTGELPLGAVHPAGDDVRVSLLPPSPDGCGAFALAVGPDETAVWQVAGGAFGPVARIPGRCSGGVWLDRTGRLLALDRELEGRTKAVAVDLGRGGEVSPLLQIAEASDDRLLLADPESGLLLIRSDAPGPGEPRLGWGVLGSSRPVRFPECLRGVGAMGATPFAVQPGQALMPETCGVALRLDEGGIGLWRPADRHVFRLGAPVGWLGGTGLWTREGRLRLPYATPDVPCALVSLAIPVAPPPPVRLDPPPPPAPRPIPLQQAPLR